MKPYYEQNGITIYHGDCLEVMPELDPASIDSIIADVPYGTTACAWDTIIPFAPMWSELKRLVKPRAAVVLFGSQPFTSALVMSNPGWFKYEVIWDKGRGFDPQLANIQPLDAHENILVFGKAGITYHPQKTLLDKPDRRNPQSGSPNRKDGKGLQLLKSKLQVGPKEYTDRFPQTIIHTKPVPQTERIHDTQKPLALLQYLILTYTNPGDLVLDFTMGSGTTIVAAKHLGRRAIGIELDERYCDIAARRLQQEVMALDEVG